MTHDGVYIGPYHSKEEIEEVFDKGKTVTTVYKDVGGKMVRQDVRVEIAEGVLVQLTPGSLT